MDAEQLRERVVDALCPRASAAAAETPRPRCSSRTPGGKDPTLTRSRGLASAVAAWPTRVGSLKNTVQDYLKSIFAKTGAPNRRVLIARAVGD